MLSIALSSLVLFADAAAPPRVAPARQSRALVRIVKPVRIHFRPDQPVADRPAQLRRGRMIDDGVEKPAILLEFS